MQNNFPIILTLGEKSFNTTKQTILLKESYLSGLLRNHNFEKSNILYIDRDPLCFPIILNYLRGYSLKIATLNKVAEESRIARKDFFALLYEDILFYSVEALLQEYEDLLYEEYPDLLLISYTSLEDYERKVGIDVEYEKEELCESIKHSLPELLIDQMFNPDEIEEDRDRILLLKKIKQIKKLNPKSSKKELQEGWTFLQNFLQKEKIKYTLGAILPECLDYLFIFIKKYTNVDMKSLSKYDLISRIKNNPGAIDDINRISEMKIPSLLSVLLSLFISIFMHFMSYKNNEKYDIQSGSENEKEKEVFDIRRYDIMETVDDEELNKYMSSELSESTE